MRNLNVILNRKKTQDTLLNMNCNNLVIFAFIYFLCTIMN